MYSKIALTLVLVAMSAIVVKVWLPSRPIADRHLPSATEVVFQTRIRDLDLRGLTRKEAIDLIQKQTHATLSVDWKSLAGFVTTEDQYQATKLDACVGDVTLASAIKVALGEQASFQVDGNTIKVAWNEELRAEEMAVRAYDIGDLVTDEFWGVATPPGQERAVQAVRANQIRSVVTQHTGANGWHINYIGSGSPGGSASISVLATRLLVTQTTDGHEAVARVLAELRHPAGDGLR